MPLAPLNDGMFRAEEPWKHGSLLALRVREGLQAVSLRSERREKREASRRESARWCGAHDKSGHGRTNRTRGAAHRCGSTRAGRAAVKRYKQEAAVYWRRKKCELARIHAETVAAWVARAYPRL